MSTETVTVETRTDRVKSFVRRHQVALTMAATTTVCFAINRASVNQYENFLADKGLTDEYHQTGEFEELL